MTPTVANIILRRNFKPTQISGLQAWYDLKDTTSYITATGVKLLGDKSGNSNTNVLALNGVSGNYASTPSTAPLSDTGSKDLIGYYVPNSYTTGTQTFCGKFQAVNGWVFQINAGANLLFFDGASNFVSTVAVSGTAFGGIWVRCRFQTNNGAGGRTAQFYTSTDSRSTSPTAVTWTQLGSNVVVATAQALSQNGEFSMGAYTAGTVALFTGIVSRIQVWNGFSDAGGTLVFDDDFSLAGKLTASHTATTGQTVTINTSGDLGARICGARDLVQMTGANQPTISSGGLLLDGTNDYMKAASFSLSQPTTVYFVGQQVTYSTGDNIFDGSGSSNRNALFNNVGSPQLAIFAGSVVATANGPATGVNAVIAAVFNGASSQWRLNRGTANTGNAGAQASNGLTLGSQYDGTAASNILVYGVLIYSGAHDTTTQNQVIGWLGQYYGIAV